MVLKQTLNKLIVSVIIQAIIHNGCGMEYTKSKELKETKGVKEQKESQVFKMNIFH